MFATDLQIRKWKDKPKTRKACGKGLYVRIFADGSKIFEFRSKQEWINLGEYPRLSLADATDIASMSRRLLKSRIVTMEGLRGLMTRAESARQLEDLANQTVSPEQTVVEMVTFSQAFRDWYNLQIKAQTWRHKASARFPIKAYELHAEKHIGDLRIDKITRSLIKQFMQPLFLTNSETARKLLGYLHKVFEIAYDNELIGGNPCPRKESFTVPKRKIRHSSSLHYSRLPELWEWLEEAPFSNPIKVAMRLAVITTHRAAVIANMRWEHLDCETGIWTVPEAPTGLSEGFMKSGRQFSMQLPHALSETLCLLPETCPYVFSVNGQRPINAETLRRNFQKFDDITTHGFRNTFKTWCLNYDVEEFLADRYCDHALKGLDKNYRRDDLFDQRAELAERYMSFIRDVR